MQRLKYQPLLTGTASIQMLAVLPSRRLSTGLKANLIYVDLDHLDQAPFAFYEALSYTWGDPDLPRASCKLNGHEHVVTVNLESALKKLRGRTRKRYLWVDALCINQDDVVERASQVQIMRRIYESAEQVLVWLGGDADESADAIRLMKRFTNADCPDDYVERSLVDKEDLAQWKAVAKLFDREWFRRVWVRQEVAVAKEIMVMCGKERIKWDTLILACDILTSPEISVGFKKVAMMVSNRGTGAISTESIELFRETWAKDRGLDLGMLLVHARGVDASDTRDRVYGLLGISDIADKLEVDYTISSQEVFKRAMITLLNHQQDLNPLSGCQWSDAVTGLPSWVINPNDDFEAMVLGVRDKSEHLYHTSGKESACFDFFEPGGLLRARGFLFDTVHTVGGGLVDDDSSELRQCLDYWLQLAQKTAALRSVRPSDDELMQEFCRTLIADQDDRGDRATTAFCRPHFDGETLTTLPGKLAEVIEKETAGFSPRVEDVCAGRIMLGTSKGYIGVTGKACKSKDVICILLGAGVPFIVRSRGPEYVLIGEACTYCPITSQNGVPFELAHKITQISTASWTARL